ncbi:sol narae isoform X2 [Leptinotarsa decemlineata]|uniref:sol narae isoform X2 n=1 Tax=Leptinotarsa decemlineata TaxID=7539 RepID=UPI000C2528E5|nr:A disintegrin and metalloproteinase with thrombospondin motifs 16 isoform X2 [Leptinotarsa decemlineata]
MAHHWVFFVTSWLFSTCASFEIHKHMSLEEIKSTFHVDTHKLVPEYELVPIQHVRKRSLTAEELENVIEDDDPDPKAKKAYDNRKLDPATNIKLRAFGKPFNLTLIPTEGLFKKGKLKIWTIEPNATAQHGVEYIELPETNEDIGELYQDEGNQAAILMRTEGDGLVLEGSIGSQLVIRPLPSRLRGSVIRSKNKNETDIDSINDDEMFLDQDGELSAEVAIDTGLPIRRNKNIHHHIVFKRIQDEEDNMSDYALMEPDHLSKRFKRSTSNKPNTRNKREAPYTIYPEILVIVDYDGYRLHGGDNLQIKRYFVSFWNGVDMRYKLLKGPKIRISIAGIIISRGRDATPYLERNRVGRDAIDSAAALTDMGKYLFRERRLPVYDIAVAITKYDMCRRRKGGRCTKGTAGFAYVGGACVVNKRLEKVNSVAIIEDTGGFSGIIVAAHEVGHLLGAVHDGSPPPSYLGGPGAEKCQWTDGFIMSDLRHTERGFRWSPCTVSSFHHFLNGDTATCLFNAPHEDDNLPRVLPGKLLTLDAQCRRDRGTSACFKDDRVCAQLFCFDAGSGYCVAYRPAAEGSPCGDGQYCLDGRCVAEHENIIPDYSQNAPSYIRGSGNPRPFLQGAEEVIKEAPVSNYNDNNAHRYYNIRYNLANTPYKNPLYHNNQNSPHDAVTTKKSVFLSISTTKSPFSFNNSKKQITSSFPNAISSFPYQDNLFSIRRQTTKSPYDFGDFGKTSQNPYKTEDLNDNYLKRSFSSSSLIRGSSSIMKSIIVDRRVS